MELLRDQFALIGKLAGSGTLKQNGRPYPKWKAVSEEAEAGRAKADAMLSSGKARAEGEQASKNTTPQGEES